MVLVNKALNFIDTKMSKFLSWKWHNFIIFPALFVLLFVSYLTFCLKDGIYEGVYGFRSNGSMLAFFLVEGFIALIGLVYLVLEIVTKRINGRKVLILLLIGASMCLVAWGFSNPMNTNVHKHDLGLYGNGGHWNIFYQIYVNGKIPDPKLGNQLYNQKAFHVLVDVFMHINSLFVHVSGAHASTTASVIANYPGYTINVYQIFEMTRVYFAFVGISCLYLFIKVYKELGFKDVVLIIASAFTMFIPQVWFIQFFGNQDGFCLLFALFAVYFALKYKNNRKVPYILASSLCVGLTGFFKFQAALIVVPVGVIVLFVCFDYLSHKQKAQFDKFMLHVIFSLAIAVPLVFFYPFYYRIVYSIPVGYVVDVAPSASAKANYRMFVDDSFYNFFQRFLLYPDTDMFFSPFNLRNRSMVNNAYVNKYGDIDFNVWTAFTKTLFFDEWGKADMSAFLGDFVVVSFYILEYAFVVTMVVSIVYAISKVVRRIIVKNFNNLFNMMFALLFFLGFAIYFILFNKKYPYGFNMNARFILPVIIPIAMVVAKCVNELIDVSKNTFKKERGGLWSTKK